MSKLSMSNRLAPSAGYLVLLLTLSVVAIVVLFSQHTASAGERPFKPVDLTCEQYADYRLKSPTAYSNSLSYVLGYLKAAQDMKMIRRISLRNTEGFLFEYCYSNPNQTLQSAIDSLLKPEMRAAYHKGHSMKLAVRDKKGAMAVRNPLENR